ncbi:MAG: septum site-determining protein MinC [Tepidimonas ignava]|jgi:septum site-determining protein MinC|uniref:Probable septum site-determining protein MinC n=1 Tax=Tepidimonas ignava TaxID=114249 RepID=A0A4R3L8S8_9BURK|nr:septum site-determining protein MinC [Tepidimonas ignava]MCX7815321.1 septum site-determining protein MinC [Tepidimonas ignava]TCS96069.1 septum site-determining protein MinC [Tepidimonas ignava]TSE21089.1 Septum site-determining protein MinC [Tepidimonas ignava]
MNSSASSTAIDIRPTTWAMLSARLRGGYVDAVLHELQQRYGDSPGFFENEPVVLDLSGWPTVADPTPLEVDALLRALRHVGLQPLGYRDASGQWPTLLQHHGLCDAGPAPTEPKRPTPSAPATPVPAPEPASAMVVDRPLRSGQQVYARGRDLVVLAAVNPGAEVIADGHVHVYAPLRGRALAGARGDATARIFTLSLQAELVSIAGVYQTAEHGWPDTVHGRATQVRLVSEAGADKLLFEPLN